MTYLDHIRNFSDGQMAYFLNAIQPEITIFSLAMDWALSDKVNNGKNYKGSDALFGLDGDARSMMSTLYKDFDKQMRDLEECRSESLDRLHDYSSGNDLRRVVGLPEKKRKLSKAPNNESELIDNAINGLDVLRKEKPETEIVIDLPESKGRTVKISDVMFYEDNYGCLVIDAE